MDTKNNLSFDESGNGKYIILKIPRRTLQGNEIDPLTLYLDKRKYRGILRTIGLIIAFLIGTIIGSIYHDHILNINSDHATWKMFTTATKVH